MDQSIFIPLALTVPLVIFLAFSRSISMASRILAVVSLLVLAYFLLLPENLPAWKLENWLSWEVLQMGLKSLLISLPWVGFFTLLYALMSGRSSDSAVFLILFSVITLVAVSGYAFFFFIR